MAVLEKGSPDMSDPVFGRTWAISKEQSRFTASTSPSTETRIYEKVGHGYKLTVSGMHDGQPYEWGYTARYDGEAKPVYGRLDVDAIVKHKVTDLITIGSFTRQGKVVAAYRRETSLDGRTLVVVASGFRPDGTTYFDVLTYKPARS